MNGALSKGALWGLGLGLFLIITEPFHPTTGLIPELNSFLTTTPLWIATLLVSNGSPIVDGIAILVYFTAVGSIVAIAFEHKKHWGWLLVIMLIVNHYVIDERIDRPMREVLQYILSKFS